MPVGLKSKNFLNYIHYFRGLAIVFIVVVHAVISIPWDNSNLRLAIITVSSNGTVLFVFISGYLFYYLCKNKFDYKNYLFKKLKFVILPYLIVSVPAIIDKLFIDPGDHWWMTKSFDNLSMIEKILYMLATGRHSGILWFIPIISIFYLISFILIRFSKTKIFNYIVPVLCILGFFTVQFGYRSNLGASFIHFLPIYLFGMWSCKFSDVFFRHLKVLLVITIVIYIVMTILELEDIIPFEKYMYLRDADEQFFVFNLSKLKATILCIFLLLAFKLFENKNWSVFKSLGDYSFGIFFLHLYLINIVQMLHSHGWLPLDTLNWFSFIIYVACIVLVCISLVLLTKMVFGKKSRMIIGS